MTLQSKSFKGQDNFEEIISFYDDTDFACWIAIHNTHLGPALGGCRVATYTSRENAIKDVKALAKGMTYKNSLAGLNFGGGKCVVWGEKPTREMMLKVGEAVNSLNGRYITAEDVGTHKEDMETIGEISKYVLKEDCSYYTACGVFSCIKAAVRWREWGNDLSNLKIFVQGLGKVGYPLFEMLRNNGAHVYVDDISKERLQLAIDNGAISVKCLEGIRLDFNPKYFADIYAPCALGQTVDENCSYPIICGSANNQLVDDNIVNYLNNYSLYCPDYLVNAGGVIACAGELEKMSHNDIVAKCETLGNKLIDILDIAVKENINQLIVANRIAEERLGLSYKGVDNQPIL